MTYALLTKFWNEIDRIPSVVATISKQTVRPLVWFLLDDGSTDGSLKLFRGLAEKDGISTICVSMPQKSKGDIDTLGRMYQLFYDTVFKNMAELDYIGMIDVDTTVPIDYFSVLVKLLDIHLDIGCIAGCIREEKRNQPMGSGKLCRWNIFCRAGRDGFWELDADTFLNIKAVAMGYRLSIVEDMFVDANKSLFSTPAGYKHLGRRMYYCRRNFILVCYRGLRMILQGKSGWQYIHGWMHEAVFNKSWRCDDTDVREFYSVLKVRAKNTKFIKRDTIK
jgi:glycosyltransferase involved in cell wall biosynthesis